MKFFIAFILTGLVSFAGGLFFPWWIIAVAAFIVALAIQQKAVPSFLAAFLALFIVWAVQSYLIDVKNEHLLATKVAFILPLEGSYVAVIFVTAFLGGLVAGMAALTASFVRRRNNHSVNNKSV